ncbi:hypothetical protein B0J14DRAFT_662414 [Halenospora varia]|nr:hypothetical protein B0J14DRAFT_662414 [Halenospora varia]
MERLEALAVSLVTTDDELLGSIEGLECVMIESVYQANIVNPRRSWVSGRRAMSITQLMGLNRSSNLAQYKMLDPKTKYHPQLMWFRIAFLDRMASDMMLANDTPMGHLERIHCVAASRILEHSHPLGTENLLAHQYHSDRAMIERVQENMEAVDCLNSDALNCPEGMNKEFSRPQATPATPNHPAQLKVRDRSRTTNIGTVYVETHIKLSGLAGPSDISNIKAMGPGDAHSYAEASSAISDTSEKARAQLETPQSPNIVANDVVTYFEQKFRKCFTDPLLQHEEYPRLAAGAED